MEDFFDDLERLESRQRELSHNGYQFVLKCEDPYGFWKVTVKREKRQPTFTESAFTTYNDAVRQCKIWAEAQSKVPQADFLEELLNTPAPVLRRKKIVNKVK